MKKNNPQTPIMIREAAGTLPKIYARYGKLRLSRYRGTFRNVRHMLTRDLTEFGNEKAQSLEGLSDKQIEETVTGLVKNGA